MTPDNAVGYGIPDFVVAHQWLLNRQKEVYAQMDFTAAISRDRLLDIRGLDEGSTFTLFDLQGSVVQEYTWQHQPIDLAGIARGLYILTAEQHPDQALKVILD
jgi:hypothetical protein